MSAVVLDGKAVAKKVRDEVALRNAAFVAKHGRPVGLAVVRVGDDPASEVYVRNKRRAAMEAGLLAEEHILPETTSQDELLQRVADLNGRDDIDAVLVQLPIPKHIDTNTVISALDPNKDVDGFHPVNAGLLATDRIGTRPCTPEGCIRLLDEAGVKVEGANAVVVGRSNIVGKPMALLLLSRNATVTVCHSRTKNLPEVVGNADIVVVAIGRGEFLKGEWVKPGAAVIDVGMNRNAAGKLVGDVEFPTAVERAGVITPVPGGVGPMTVAMLLSNAVDLAERRVK